MDFSFIVIIVYSLYIFVTAAGYISYKFGLVKAKTWEEGVKKVLTGGFYLIYKAYCFLYEGATGKEIPEKVIDSALICSNDELLDLVDLLNNHPYDTPSLESYVCNENGKSEYDVRAVGLSAAYKDISNEQIATICYNVIQNYFMKTRGRKVPLSIKVATPTRLYFIIILSEEARKRLEKQLADTTAKPDVVADELLTEKVNTDGILGEKAHDSGIPKD